MEEDFTTSRDSAKNCSISVEEGEKVKDFVYQHFKDMSDGPLFNNVEQSSNKDHANFTEKDKRPLNKTHYRVQQGAVFSGNILSFGCSVCKDNFRFSPNDLLKHFRAVHKGALPTYPCDLCEFVTNEFPVLQRHRIEHRNTLVTCELCNDGIQYSLLLLTRHYIMSHSLNGQFNCDWCEFTTMDAGTFVQHIHHHNENHWKCSKCRHISLSEGDHLKHMRAHSDTFSFTCRICGYGTSKMEFLQKHKAAVHKEEAERSTCKTLEDSGTPSNSSASIKVSFKKSGDLQEAQRLPKLNNILGSLPNQNGRILTSEISLEETHQLIERSVVKKDNKSWNKVSHNTELSTQGTQQEFDNTPSSDAASHTNGNGLTVVMVKNKISLPPNCTTKVMGFKVVDGKKHLVLKVIPTTKQDLNPNHSLIESVRSAILSPVVEKSKDPVEVEPDVESSTSQRPDISPKDAACTQMDQDDILAVKVKIEEDETPIYNLNSTPHRDDVEEQHLSQNRAVTCTDTLLPVTNESNVSEQGHPDEKSHTGERLVDIDSPFQKPDATSLSCVKVSHTTIMCKGTGVVSQVAQETLLSKQPVSRNTETCGTVDELLVTDGDDKFIDQHTENPTLYSTEENNPSSQVVQEKQDIVWTEVKHQNGLTPSSRLITSLCSKERATSSERCVQNLPNQEIYTFHNYSKETFSTLPNTTDNLDSKKEHSADEDSVCESPPRSSAVVESPGQLTDSADELEVDECFDNSLAEENPDSVLQDFNIIKVEEENIPICKKQPEIKSSSTSLQRFVEEQSDAVINTVRTAANISNDPLKQTKTALRFFQLPESKQPVLLRATENILSMPVQVKATPGFQLISSSTNPQINVSYMKPALERSGNVPGGTVTPNSRGVPVVKPGSSEKGTAVLSTVHPGRSTTSNHYLINTPGFKGPVLLSSTPHEASTDKTAKTQPTCYLVQRSAPVVQTPSTQHLKLGTTAPVLAMSVGATDKPNPLQNNRQAFLLRYISPPKLGQPPKTQEATTGTQSNQTTERSGNKVIFKIVSPTRSLLKKGAPPPSKQPLFLATRPQTQCFLVSSNKPNAAASNNVKTLLNAQPPAQTDVKESCISASQMNVKVQPCAAEKPILAPRPIRPPSQRKRNRKILFDELPTMGLKARRLSNRAPVEKETPDLWTPVAKEVERTLRLAPISSQQSIKCPRRYQPVVVLNHPDADIPEVANIMKVVTRYKGAITKVSLSQKTIQALSVLGSPGGTSSTKGASLSPGDGATPRPVQSCVRERFILKMKLRKKNRKKYEVVKTLSGCQQQRAFSCWFCGRLFNSQEDWIGHGQRHLMEATRDWNKLF